MTNHDRQTTQEFPADSHAVGATDEMRDLLLSRAVQGERTALEAVIAAGERDPHALVELARWQADELRLVRAAAVLDTVARGVEMPSAETLAPRSISLRWRAALGWGIAAVLAIALLGQSGLLRARAAGSDRTQVAGLGAQAFANADDAFDAYLSKAREEGLVVGDPQPPTLVRSRELTDGAGFEVIVLRTVYERRRTPALYRLAPIDEAGTIRPILIRPRTESVQ